MTAILDFFAKKSPAHAFEALMKPHVGHLYRVAYRLTGQPEAAEDLVQDIMLHLYPKLDELKQIANLKPWLARALYNRFIDNIRKDKRNPVSDAMEDTMLETVTDHNLVPEHEAEHGLLHQRLDKALNQLNEDQRQVVMLHDMEGYTLTELSEVMSVPVGTLKSRLHRARHSIRQALEMEPSETLLRVKG